MKLIEMEKALSELCLSHKDIIYIDKNETAERIRKIPSIDIELKRGEWKRRIVDNGFNADWVCSECGYRVKTDFVDYNFCPNCGADMREREGE